MWRAVAVAPRFITRGGLVGPVAEPALGVHLASGCSCLSAAVDGECALEKRLGLVGLFPGP